MSISFSSARRIAAGAIGASAVAGAMLFGGYPHRQGRPGRPRHRLVMSVPMTAAPPVVGRRRRRPGGGGHGGLAVTAARATAAGGPRRLRRRLGNRGWG